MQRPKTISLFSGAGGLEYGLERAGFDLAVAVEIDRDSCRTLRQSRPAWAGRVIEQDLLELTTRKLLTVAGLAVGEADLLVGGPPCQPFSKAGYWKRRDSLRLDDPRASTLDAYLQVLREAQPRAFILENVEGLRFRGKDEGLQLLLSEIEKINAAKGTRYKPEMQVLNAADYGVPQMRDRLFVVGSRDGTKFKFPQPTHAAVVPKGSNLEPHRTAWDAIGDLQDTDDPELVVTGKWAALLPSIPEGSNYLHHTPEGLGEPLFGWRRRYWTFLLKLAKRLPSWTIAAQPGPAAGPFHWKNRRLSARELCRLQTFPEDVVIVGGRTSTQRQIGNAVPSLLAEVLGREIRVQLLGLPALATPLELLPPRRPVVPRRHPTRPVPPIYDQYRGDHLPHPGVGRGPGAQQSPAVVRAQQSPAVIRQSLQLRTAERGRHPRLSKASTTALAAR